MVNDELVAKRGDETIVIIDFMKRKFDADNVEVVVDSKNEEQVVMEEELDTTTALWKHQDILREVTTVEVQSKSN